MEKKTNNGRKGASRRRDRSRTDGWDASPGLNQASVLTSGIVVKTKPLFGYKKRCTVTYYTNSAVTSGASSAGAYVFSANGLYDPDITGSGGQPMGFDQMMIYFNHYTVHSCRIRVVFGSNSSALRATVALMTSGSSTAVTVIENAVENGDIAFQVLEFAGTFGGTATFTRNLDIGRFQAVVDVLDDPNMRGDATANPVEQAYYHLMVWCADSSTVVSAGFQVVLEYDVTFHEPRKASLS